MGKYGTVNKNEDGTIKSLNAKDFDEEILIADLYTGDFGNGGGTNPENPSVATGPNGKPLVTTVTTTEHTDNVKAEDSLGNPVVIPAGFKVVLPNETNGVVYADSNNPCVTDGIVIQDEAGNQFVWIPVGTINDGTDTPKTITLGRYTFASDGTETLVQPVEGTNTYTSEVTIDSYYIESQPTDTGKSSYGNAIAKNINDFIEKTNANGGYYLARYEAGVTGTTDNYNLSTKTATDGTVKPLSQYGVGVWNSITQLDATTVAQAMYTSDKFTSDLANSYAWDTAIVFIQTFSGDNDYSMQVSLNGSLATTGASGDRVCNIYDMASNTYEWSTETYAYSISPCVTRGGYCSNSNKFASGRVHEPPYGRQRQWHFF